LFKSINFSLPFYGFSQAVNLVAPLIVTPYLIGVCGYENFGKITFALTIAFLLNVIIDYGADIILVKEVSINRNDKTKLSKIFSIAYFGRLPLLLGLLLTLTLLIFIVPMEDADRKLYLLTLFIFAGQYLNPIWFLQGINKFKTISFLNILNKLLYVSLVFLFVKVAPDFILVNLFWGISLILSSLAGLCYCTYIEKTPLQKVTGLQIRKYLKDDFQFFTSQVLLALKNYSPIVILSVLGGFSVVGMYRIIEQIITPIRTYMQVFFRFFYPKLCYDFSESRQEGMAYWKKINLLNILFVTLILCGIYTFSIEIIHYFNIESALSGKLSKLLQFALLIPLLYSVNASLEQLVFILKSKATYFKVILFMFVTGSILSTSLFLAFGLQGIIVSLIVIEMLTLIIYLLLVKKKNFNGTN